MAHRFEIRKNKKGEFVAYFCYNSETMFWTEGYSSKAGAKKAIEFAKVKAKLNLKASDFLVI